MLDHKSLMDELIGNRWHKQYTLQKCLTFDVMINYPKSEQLYL